MKKKLTLAVIALSSTSLALAQNDSIGQMGAIMGEQAFTFTEAQLGEEDNFSQNVTIINSNSNIYASQVGYLFSPVRFRYRAFNQKYNDVYINGAFKTRGFLTIHGRLADEPVTVIVCHWPSRFSGPFYRESAARQVKAIKDELLKKDPERKIFVMGDMNDDPVDKSMYQVLGAKPEISKVKDGDMYNPWYNLLAKQGVGTLSYNGAWNLFDQIVMTPNLLGRAGKKDFSKLTFWKHAIQRMPYLFQTEGKYKGTPKRTTAGGVWLDGYSDHLPVCVYLVKEQK